MKTYVLAEQYIHFTTWLNWYRQQIPDIKFKPGDFSHISNPLMIRGLSNESSFLYYNTAWDHKDYREINRYIRETINATPKCAVCFQKVYVRSEHRFCLVHLYTRQDRGVSESEWWHLGAC